MQSGPFDTFLHNVNRKGGTPPIGQVTAQPTQAIALGDLRPGDRLPAEPELARQFGMAAGHRAWHSIA